MKKGMGWGTEVRGEGWRPPGLGASEVGLVLLEFHHEVVDVDELGPGREGSQLRLRQHPVEAMIELDQLGQSSLDDAGSISEVGEAPHHILTQRLHRRFPGTAEATDQLSNPGFFPSKSFRLSTLNQSFSFLYKCHQPPKGGR